MIQSAQVLANVIEFSVALERSLVLVICKLGIVTWS